MLPARVRAAEEQRDDDGARQDDLQELAQEEHAEAQSAALDEVADDPSLASARCYALPPVS